MFDAFWSSNYAPHGYCLFWSPGLVATHITADAVIAAAYFSIPIALVTLMRRRRDLEFGWIFWCFATFIMACGLTHIISIWTLFQGVYGIEALVKVITAIASIATAIVLWPLLPKAAALPSPAKLQAANAELAAMIGERDRALEELRGQIAQRERAEAALLQSQKLEAVGQLTGGIAHDFNNLLQAVAGNLELIARKPGEKANVARWTASAREALDRGRSLTGQLLAFSRKQKLDLTSVRVADLIGGMRDLIERAVAPLSTVNVGEIDPHWNVEADALQLELAILNLAFNARDAMPEGGTLTITAERLSGQVLPELEAGDYVALTVADTGTGMAPEVLARALEPFFTTKEVGKGTGMGLSMAFGVLRQSRGSLRVESAPGQGTRITLFLRMTEAEPARDHGESGAVAVGVRLDGRAITLIDDDAGVRAALSDALTGAGAVVRQAGYGASGLDLMAGEVPDLMIVDFAMPGMTGAEVTRRVREAHPAMPVLMVTGFADSTALDTMRGEVTILRKPFQSDELLRRVAEMLG
jgi:signal transduction histidine kinase